MTTRRSVFIIIIAAIVALALQVALGTFLSAKLSTWPVLRRLNFLNPQAPIVINNREITRVSDSGDLVDVVNKIKPKISAVVAVQNGSATTVGTAVNLTSDGVFLTSYNSFLPQAHYAVVLNGGRIIPVTETVIDPATKLAFLKTTTSEVSIAQLANSKDLAAGEKVALVNANLTPLSARFSAGYIGAGQDDAVDKIMDASRPGRSFVVNASNGSIPGSVIVNISGEITGIWTGDRAISSDVMKNLLSVYFAGNGKIARPEFGFNYQFLTQPQATLLTASPGAQVKSIDKSNAKQPSPAAAAGLQAGDVIVDANGTKIDRATALEEVSEQIKPGQSLTLSVIRGTSPLTVTLIAGELK